MKNASKVLGVLVVAFLASLGSLGCKPADEEAPVIASITIEDNGSYRSVVTGDRVEGIVSVVVAATDNVGIKEVQFFINNVKDWQPVPAGDSITQDGDNYTYYWNTMLLEDSVQYSISAVAFDEAGNYSDTSDILTRLVRIPNWAPDSAGSMTPLDGDTLDTSAAIVLLAWKGSDPDDYPPQELKFAVYFGTNPNNLEKVADTIPEREDTSTYWSTFSTEKHLVPETDYYWMIMTIDPYGLKTPSKTLKFARPVNKPPPAAGSPSPQDTSKIAYPYNDTIGLSWVCNEPDRDSLIYRLYVADGPNWTDNARLVADSLTTASYRLPLDGPGTYYWRAVPEDQWGATTSTDSSKWNPNLWQFEVE
ncbi:hypothetical protein JXM67_10235 [candidate division WOR-3 bacterium]|nr:hypothetical protein [candidate division WOR-3 bacterium]